MNEAVKSALDSFLATHGSIVRTGSLASGTDWAGWRIRGLVGRGASSEVYVAQSSSTNQLAALKVSRNEKDAARAALFHRRFLCEREVLARGDGNFLPRLYDSGVYAGRDYLVMELLEEIVLPRQSRAVARFILKVATCVAALHAQGWVHRDIKPQNLMRRTTGELVLVDLALAKRFVQGNAARAVQATQTQLAGRAVGAGTPRYAAPEQFIGGEISPASDVHALGRLIDECFQGQVPRSWERIVARATSSDPARRYADVAGLMQAIRTRHRRARLMALGLGMSVGLGLLIGYGEKHFVSSSLESPPRALSVEQVQWKALWNPVVTNVVREETFEELWKTNQAGHVFYAGRRYHRYTNEVEIIRIDLKGQSYQFNEPIQIPAECETWVVGPGRLSATFAGSREAVLRVFEAEVVNYNTNSLADVGVSYRADKGGTIIFPRLTKWDQDLEYAQVEDGATGEIRYGQ